MNKLKSTFVLLFLLSNLITLPQTFVVNTNSLNVRELPSKTADKIASLSKNDTINALSIDDDWVKIDVQNKFGFVNKKYLIRLENEKESKKLGFTNVFKKTFFIVLVFSLLIMTRNKKVKDNRFSNGYRTVNSGNNNFLAKLIYALILSTLLACITGTIAWIRTF
ncbi:SH3 domain-containing protein [Flavobacterium davisii]|uniref:SH3 domain-containing protein n=1 Tax=Flavobacterium davisii TaxID=2906077 RepID=A0ABW8PLT3_9FLAO